MRLILACVACVGLWAGAQTPTEATDLNDLMALRSKTIIEAYQLQIEIRQAWNDPKYTSPEIELLRRKIEDLQAAILHTQATIQAKVEKMPEVQAKIKQAQEVDKQVEALTQQIERKQGAK